VRRDRNCFFSGIQQKCGIWKQKEASGLNISDVGFLRLPEGAYDLDSQRTSGAEGFRNAIGQGGAESHEFQNRPLHIKNRPPRTFEHIAKNYLKNARILLREVGWARYSARQASLEKASLVRARLRISEPQGEHRGQMP